MQEAEFNAKTNFKKVRRTVLKKGFAKCRLEKTYGSNSYPTGVVGEHSVRVEARPRGLVDITEERMLA